MAIAWDGIENMAPEIQPPVAVKIPWGMAVESYTKRYAHYCRTVAELYKFYADNGITMVQLKGVGLSSYYPKPERREGGDIDIYTCSADRSKMPDHEANALADQLMRDKGINVDMEHGDKHSIFMYSGIPVENHHTFINPSSKSARKVQEVLEHNLKPVEINLLGNPEYRISIPSPAFNTVFVPYHAINHYGCGIALHHLFDWACLIDKYGVNIPEDIGGKRFVRAMKAFTLLSNRLLGTDVKVDADEALADRIYEELMHPKFTKANAATHHTKAGIFLYKTRRVLHRMYIRRDVADESFIAGIIGSLVEHLRFPKTIFSI